MALTGEEMDYMGDLEGEVSKLRRENSKMISNSSLGQTSMFSQQSETNLIQWQLDLNEELERVEHLLKGDVIKRKENGDEYWAQNENDNHKPFNDHGVQLLMGIITFYLNRNTILANYDEETINWKVKDLGDEIADLIFLKHEEMGMNTLEKKKLYPIMVRQLVDTIHSAYLRALHGGERESLRTARYVTQSDSVQGDRVLPTPQKKFSMFRPTTWQK